MYKIRWRTTTGSYVNQFDTCDKKQDRLDAIAFWNHLPKVFFASFQQDGHTTRIKREQIKSCTG
jgi:hypothetical protein